MATALQFGENSRYTDISDEPVDRLLSPIRGYEDKPLLPLNETVQPIRGFFNDIEDNVYVALHNCQNPADNLTQQESASIHLYTMHFHGEASLYALLNQSLRAKDREELKPWFSFLKLFLTALYKLPSQSKTVWRGVRNVDLSPKYKTGTKFAWWGVSSCTTDIEVLKSSHFLGQRGQRTLFSIECINGKSISNHSYFNDKEKEIILMPGSYFEVIGRLNPAPELYLIHLKEISPPITFVKPPFSKPSDMSPLSLERKRNVFSQILLKMRSKSTTSEGSVEEISIESNTRRKSAGCIIAGGNGRGDELNQLFLPHGIFIDDDQTIYIADYGNHRIVEWKSHARYGQIVAGGNKEGDGMNQLRIPSDVIIDKEDNSFIIADLGNRRVMQWFRQNNGYGQVIISNIDCYALTMDKNGNLYVSDWQNHEVKRWKRGDKDGTIVAGGNGKGNHLNQLNHPGFIFVDEDYSLYISDEHNHRVMKWTKGAKEGIVVAGGNGKGKKLSQLYYPCGVIVDQLGQIYVADSNNNRVMRWCQESTKGSIVLGGTGKEGQSHQLFYPKGLSFDRQGNLYLADLFSTGIQKFEIDKNENNLFSEIEF